MADVLWKTWDELIPPLICSPSGRYNVDVPLTIRDFKTSDFEALWRIDQTCFPPGISYSRAELRLYLRRRASFTLVAEGAPPGNATEPAATGSREGILRQPLDSLSPKQEPEPAVTSSPST
jgi:hypothetical protein